MMRRQKRNHLTRCPRELVCVDTETIAWEDERASGHYRHTLRLGCAAAVRWEGGQFTRRVDFDFFAAHEFWDWLGGRLTTERATWVWAHSAGFDLTAMRFWEQLELGNYRLTGCTGSADEDDQGGAKKPGRQGLLVTEDPPTIIVAQHRSGAWVKFVCTLNWFPVPLRELGAILGCPKGDMPGDSGEEADWLAYCRQDVEVLLAAVERIYRTVTNHDLGSLKYTAAGQSLASFRHLSPTTLPCIHDDKLTRALERACYYGGRSQCHFVGHVLPANTKGLEELQGVTGTMDKAFVGPLTHLDMTGAYPSVMRGNVYPNAWIRTERLCSPARAFDYLRSYCCCAEVTLRSQRTAYPLRSDGHVVYGTGTMRTYLAGPELFLALSLEHVQTVHLIALYSAVEMFTGWVDQLWELRAAAEKNDEPLMARLFKHLLNALHGKYAQSGHGWELDPTLRADHPWGLSARRHPETGEWHQYRSIAGAVQWLTAEKDGRDAFPAISAYVTSYLRIRMREIMEQAGERNTVYEDVDTLHVTQEGFNRLIRAGWVKSAELGRFKIEARADRACYWGPRFYDFGPRSVRAGLSGRAKVVAAGQYQGVKFARLNELLNDRPPDGPVMWDELVELQKPVLRVQVGPDGWTRPLHGDWLLCYTPLGPDAGPKGPGK